MKRTGKTVGAIMAALLAAALLWLSFRDIDWPDFIADIRICDWRYLLLSAIAGGLMPACRALRWRLAVIPFDRSVTRRTAVTANYAAYLMNMAVPYTHEATRCMLVHRRSDRDASSYDRLVGIAVMERVCDACLLLLLLVFVCVSSPAVYGAFFKGLLGTQSGRRTAIVAAVSVAAIFSVFMIMSTKFSDRNRFLASVHRFMKGVRDGFRSIARLDRPWLFWFYTAAIWFIYWLQIRMMSVAMPQMSEVGPAGSLLLCLAGQLATVVPVPGGFGAFHYVIAVALTTVYGIQRETGMAFATLVHESQALVMIIAGSFSWLALRMKGR